MKYPGIERTSCSAMTRTGGEAKVDPLALLAALQKLTPSGQILGAGQVKRREVGSTERKLADWLAR